jgi:hypothetical protein
LPGDAEFTLEKPLGNPKSECARFGLAHEGSLPVYWIKKCGLDYEGSKLEPDVGQCRSGKDMSHITPCYCPEEE